MIQHFHGVPSWCALIARWTIASPILFSTLRLLTIVLVTRPVNGEKDAGADRADEGACEREQSLRCDEELILDVYEMFRQLNRCK